MNSDALLEETYILLSESPQSMRAVADAAGVNYWWLRKFNLRRSANPGVRTVERLHQYLLDQRDSQVA